MTLQTAAIIDAVSTDADALRRVFKLLASGQQGVALSTDLAVTTSGGMVSVIAAGDGTVNGTQNVVTQGAYGIKNDAAVSQTHAASDPTNPRNDLVGIKIEDAFYSGANKQATPVIVTGTPAASPADPAAPANWLPLARVRVNAGASTLGTITDLRTLVLPWSWNSAGLATLRNALLIPAAAGGTPAASSYGSVGVKIDEVGPLGGAQASVTLPVSGSLPTGYRHLEIEYIGRGTTVATLVECGLRFNGVSTNSYAAQRLQAANASVSGDDTGGSAVTSIQRFFLAAASSPANAPGWGKMWIPHYNGTSFFKVVLISWGMVPSVLGSNPMYTGQSIGYYNSTSAIASITLFPLSGNFDVGSLFTIRGIP